MIDPTAIIPQWFMELTKLQQVGLIFLGTVIMCAITGKVFNFFNRDYDHWER